MTKRSNTVMGVVAWLTGVLVSLAVGFAMTARTLTVPYVPLAVTVFAGWVVVITTLISAILAIVNFKL
ncbi:hypothetical protein M0R19_02455 [Candidatus Pacearchaeota archaeon]|jgi:hypothetical protein|nr:hypothetical protein [Candidatus Pacearchaeota archaeon]